MISSQGLAAYGQWEEALSSYQKNSHMHSCIRHRDAAQPKDQIGGWEELTCKGEEGDQMGHILVPRGRGEIEKTEVPLGEGANGVNSTAGSPFCHFMEVCIAIYTPISIQISLLSPDRLLRFCITTCGLLP